MEKIKRLVKVACAVTAISLITACGGGGGGGDVAMPISPVSPISTYQAGLTIGDNGVLTIDTSAMTYSITITHSSFGLQGKTINGAITDNGDGTYHIAGTKYGTIFTYPNYSVMALKIDPTNPDYATYYRLNPNLTSATYIPIFAARKESLLTTVDDITSNGQSLEMRSVSMGMTVSNGNTSYLSEASRGTISKISNNAFSVASCSNGGISANNSNLNSANCVGGIVKNWTFTYDSSASAWLVTPVDPLYTSQVVRAYFVKDVMANSIAGYIDTSDATSSSSKFAIATIVPASTTYPIGSTGTATLTTYQLCSSDSNCASTNGEQGIYYTNTVQANKLSAGTRTAVSSWQTDGCDVTNTTDYFSVGFNANYYTAGSGNCTNPGDRPDTVIISLGLRTINGKGIALIASAGYDSTVSPSQKIAIGYLKMN